MTLQIGYAQATVTPALDRPVYLAGFGQNRAAKSVHDELFARALALEQGKSRLVTVALDLIGLGRDHCQEIERRIDEAAPGTRLFLACTHTHHGPDTIGLWGPDPATSGVDTKYVADLKDRVVETALAAMVQREPALMRCTSVRVTGLVKNTRDPEILDEELACVQFCHPQTSAPLVTWLIYPCHPEVLWEHNPHITSDYIARMRQVTEAETGAPCLAMVGAIGGMMTPDVLERSFGEAEQMGRALAQAALEALSGTLATRLEGLKHTRLEYSIPMTNPLFQMAMQAGLLPSLLDDGTVTTEVNLLQLGRAWLLGVPGELLPKLGLALKAEMRQAGAGIAAIVGLTNDELGYILPQEDYVYPDDPFAPGEHYEETMSVGPDAGPRLREAAKQALAEAKTW